MIRDLIGQCQCLDEFVCFVQGRRSGFHLLVSTSVARMRESVQ